MPSVAGFSTLTVYLSGGKLVSYGCSCHGKWKTISYFMCMFCFHQDRNPNGKMFGTRRSMGGLKRNITFWVHCVKQQLPSIHYYYHFSCFVVVVSTVVIVLYHNMSLCRAHVLIILNSYQTKTSLDSVEYIRKNTDKRFRILGCCCCFCFIACHNQDMWNKISDSHENIKYLFW